MTRVKRSPTIQKPTIDEEMVLRFASEEAGSASRPAVDRPPGPSPKRPAPKRGARDGPGPGRKAITITIRKEIYDRIAEEALRKNRSVEEHLEKHLTKRYGE